MCFATGFPIKHQNYDRKPTQRLYQAQISLAQAQDGHQSSDDHVYNSGDRTGQVPASVVGIVVFSVRYPKVEGGVWAEHKVIAWAAFVTGLFLVLFALDLVFCQASGHGAVVAVRTQVLSNRLQRNRLGNRFSTRR